MPGKDYHAQSWIKILNDKPGTLGQTMELEVDFHFPGEHKCLRDRHLTQKVDFHFPGEQTPALTRQAFDTKGRLSFSG